MLIIMVSTVQQKLINFPAYLILKFDSEELYPYYTFKWKVLNNREAGRRGDSTVVVLVAGHHDVAILSPTLSPAAVKRKRRVINLGYNEYSAVYLFLTSQ